MSYIRKYPERNTTIFKVLEGFDILESGDVNTGKNPVMELMDGNGRSTPLFGFNIDDLRDVLNNHDFECRLFVWDATALFEPLLDLKNIDLIYFEKEFIEGNGFSFRHNKAERGVSNFNERKNNVPWGNTLTQDGLFPAKHLNDVHEDLQFDVTQFIQKALNNNANPNFGITVSNPETGPDRKTKFLRSRHTKTIFKPYLEFKIDDEITDDRHDARAAQTNRFYLLNDTGQDFVGSNLNVEIIDSKDNVIDQPTIHHPRTGVYYVEYTPTKDQINELIFDKWIIDSETIARNPIQVTSPNRVFTRAAKFDDLFFYPATTYARTNIRKGDVIEFELISEKRGEGKFLFRDFEYRVVAANGFEMVPWTPVSLYNNRMFFIVHTHYFFQDIEYEVFVRLNSQQFTKTSELTYEFRVIADGPSHLNNKHASPYNNRDWMLSTS